MKKIKFYTEGGRKKKNDRIVLSIMEMLTVEDGKRRKEKIKYWE